MPVITRTITISSNGENDMIDITHQINEAMKASILQDGIVAIFVSGSTAAVTTIEYEPGLKKDFPKMLARIAPSEIEYEHDKYMARWKWTLTCACVLDRAKSHGAV